MEESLSIVETPTTAIALLRTPETTDGGLEALFELGAEALQPLVDVVLDASESNRVREIAAQAVGRIVPEGVQRLLALLNSAEGDVADLAAWGLRFNHSGATIEPELFSMLTSPCARVRTNAARALRYIHVDLQSCDPRLLAAVHDESPSVRADALRTLVELADVDLSRYGVDASAIDTAARMVLDDLDETVRDLAKELLYRLSSTSDLSAHPQLRKGSPDRD